MSNTVTWYLARLPDGRFSRGESWVSDIADARLYRVIGPAKAAVTRWVKENPGAGIPDILEWKLDVATATVLDVAGETQKRIDRAAKQKAAREEEDRKRRLADIAEQESCLAAERARLERKAS